MDFLSAGGILGNEIIIFRNKKTEEKTWKITLKEIKRSEWEQAYWKRGKFMNDQIEFMMFFQEILFY